MASDIEQTPFVKQLGSSDRPTREKALSSLRTYLTSNHAFTDLELLKLWKGLFFCVWHSDRPLPQQRLVTSLSHLLLTLPRPLFIPFLTAFWTTIAREWTSIDVFRMDKFLSLVRNYVNAAFKYIACEAWDASLLKDLLQLIETFPLNPENIRIPDGLRYHVMDVWVDELDRVDTDKSMPLAKEILGPIWRLEREGVTKTVRKRAKEILGDERLKDWDHGKEDGGEVEKVNEGDETNEYIDDEGEWGGLED